MKTVLVTGAGIYWCCNCKKFIKRWKQSGYYR